MERGLLWLPLLVFFVGLAWTGWREYQKVETYQKWAESFDRAKYDIFSVLGQKDDQLTWGVPTPQGPIQLETFSLKTVQSIRLLVNGQPVEIERSLGKGRAELEFVGRDRTPPIRIPFTEPSLASQWGQHLQKELQRLQSEPSQNS
uniref:Uncharacterized protein n=1 Tax=Oscillatoriales cyanobacterium SpSt-402 TaxID=2282168 RepID=A0A832H1W1_9CYAN